MKVCITGGSGFVGTKLTQILLDDGHDVLILDRNKPRLAHHNLSFIKTDFESDKVSKEVLSCNALIHLAGVNIFGRWTKKYKKQILRSRIDPIYKLLELLSQNRERPQVFISASAVGYYGDRDEEILTEESSPGTDFLARVCVKWEKATQEFKKLNIRAVSVRTGIVIGPGGGMLAKLIPIFKIYLGGKLGSGEQWFSWIHIDDLIEIYKKILLDGRLVGAVNAVAPNPVRNKELTSTLGRVIKRPVLFRIPKIILRIILGQLAYAVIGSQQVIPKKLRETGFNYKYPDIYKALIKSIY